MSKFYITTPIYYVNDVPHIGHTYTTVAADVLARFNRLIGKKVFFLTGSDEHGNKIYQQALQQNIDPKEHCDRIVEEFKKAWKEMEISYDYFIRTTDTNHEETVKKILTELNIKGQIYKAKYEGIYCIQCEKFLKGDELVGDGLCPDHMTKPIKHSEENYFFKLSKYKEKLIEIISEEKNKDHFEILPTERKNEILGKLRSSELEDISISRANLPWAIPVPFDSTQTVYVWIDALINYISAIGYCAEFGLTKGIDTSNFHYWWPADVHLIGKDILWFHAVIWPAMLLALELPLPKRIFAHGYFTIAGQKMSKTIGNVIKPDDLIREFGSSASRILILNAFPFGSDGDISLNDFKEKYNAHLANNIGNLFSRVLNMVVKYFDGKIEKPSGWTDSEISSIKKSFLEYLNSLENLSIDEGLKQILNVSSFANQYVDKESPWSLAKTDKKRLEIVLYNCLLILKHLAVLLAPFAPSISDKVWETIGEKENICDVFKKLPEFSILTSDKVNKLSALFPKK